MLLRGPLGNNPPGDTGVVPRHRECLETDKGFYLDLLWQYSCFKGGCQKKAESSQRNVLVMVEFDLFL